MSRDLKRRRNPFFIEGEESYFYCSISNFNGARNLVPADLSVVQPEMEEATRKGESRSFNQGGTEFETSEETGSH